MCRQRGFSLLETLAAMLLLALCFGALMRAAGSSLSLSSRAEGYTQASLWASTLLDRTFVTEFPAEGMHEGVFDATYRWTMRVSAPAENGLATYGGLHLYDVDLRVEWTEGGRPAFARFVTRKAVSPPLEPKPLSSMGDS